MPTQRAGNKDTLAAGSANIGDVDVLTLPAVAHKWSAQGTFTLLIAGDASSPTLKNLSNNANKLGGAVDNSDAAARNIYADFQLRCRGQSAFTAGATISLWLIPATDGTNYSDGDDSTTPARPPDALFYVRAVSTQQVLVARGVLLPPGLFKPLIRNEGGQALTNTNDENQLHYRPYSEAEV